MILTTTIAASAAFSDWSSPLDVRLHHAASALAASDAPALLRSELNEWMMDCVRDGWDGHGAQAVSNQAYAAALRFVEALPPGFQVPDVAVDPDGCFTFEWRRGARRTVLVSVHPDFTVHYAALMGASHHYGDEPFFNKLPSGLERLIEHLFSM